MQKQPGIDYEENINLIESRKNKWKSYKLKSTKKRGRPRPFFRG